MAAKDKNYVIWIVGCTPQEPCWIRWLQPRRWREKTWVIETLDRRVYWKFLRCLDFHISKMVSKESRCPFLHIFPPTWIYNLNFITATYYYTAKEEKGPLPLRRLQTNLYYHYQHRQAFGKKKDKSRRDSLHSASKVNTFRPHYYPLVNKRTVCSIAPAASLVKFISNITAGYISWCL